MPCCRRVGPPRWRPLCRVCCFPRLRQVANRSEPRHAQILRMQAESGPKLWPHSCVPTKFGRRPEFDRFGAKSRDPQHHDCPSVLHAVLDPPKKPRVGRIRHKFGRTRANFVDRGQNLANLGPGLFVSASASAGSASAAVGVAPTSPEIASICEIGPQTRFRNSIETWSAACQVRGQDRGSLSRCCTSCAGVSANDMVREVEAPLESHAF